MEDWGQKIQEIAKDWLFSDLDLEGFPQNIILPLENPDLYDRAAFTAKMTRVENYKSISIGYYRGVRVGVLNSKFGGPAVAMVVHTLSKTNTNNLIGVGYCGGLQKNIQCGDLVLPFGCVRDEGSCDRYVSKAYPAIADFTLHNTLIDAVREANLNYHSGLVWTTDAVLLETSTLVGEWSNKGILGVDMESSVLFTIARLFKIKAAAILVASDNPIVGKEAIAEKLAEGINRAIDISFNCLQSN